jgi:2-phosphosulfolactate phosphatase
VEDLLGAGAIAACFPADLSRSPEIRAAVAAFHVAVPTLEQTLLQCGSGVELAQRGFEDDVRYAARWNALQVVPRLVDGERIL